MSENSVNSASFKKKGVLAVIGCTAVTFNSGALFFGFPGIMSPYWKEAFSASTSDIGLIMTFACLGVGIFMLFSGKLQPKTGTRISMMIGSLILVGCSIMGMLASNMVMVYIWAFLNGAGTGWIYGPSIATVQKWFPRRRGFVTGIVNLFFGSAAAIMTPVYKLLLSNIGYVNLNWVVFAMIIVINGLSIIVAEEPSHMKLNDEEVKYMNAQIELSTVALKGSSPSMASKSMTVKEALKCPKFWFIWLTWLFVGAAGIAMVNHGGGFAESIGLASVTVITAFNLTNGISRIIAGTLSDLIGRNITGFIAFLLGAAGYIILPFCSNIVIVCILAAFVGFSFGTLFSISAPLASDIFGMKYYSMIFSLIFSAYGFLSGVFGPMLMGFLVQSFGNYKYAFWVMAAFCIIGSVLILLAAKKSSKKN